MTHDRIALVVGSSYQTHTRAHVRTYARTHAHAYIPGQSRSDPALGARSVRACVVCIFYLRSVRRTTSPVARRLCGFPFACPPADHSLPLSRSVRLTGEGSTATLVVATAATDDDDHGIGRGLRAHLFEPVAHTFPQRSFFPRDSVFRTRTPCEFVVRRVERNRNSITSLFFYNIAVFFSIPPPPTAFTRH